jgi:hypothetical protein
MKRFQLIVLPACVALVAPVAFLSVAHAKQCSVEPPANARSFWSYRLIDGRKCWYEGKPMLSKSLLEWPPAQALAAPPSHAEPDSRKALMIENSLVLNDNDGFEARWRARFLDAMGSSK